MFENTRQTSLDISTNLTLLFATDGKKLAKRIRADGSKVGYDLAYQFISTQTPITTIDELSAIIKHVSQHQDRNICIIRGAPRPHLDAGQKHRRTLDHYQDVPRSWALFDIDDASKLLFGKGGAGGKGGLGSRWLNGTAGISGLATTMLSADDFPPEEVVGDDEAPSM